MEETERKALEKSLSHICNYLQSLPQILVILRSENVIDVQKEDVINVSAYHSQHNCLKRENYTLLISYCTAASNNAAAPFGTNGLPNEIFVVYASHMFSFCKQKLRLIMLK